MTERLNHKLNVDTIKTVKDVKNVFYTMELVASMDEDNPIYEVAKEYFTIPYVPPELKFSAPRKSIEEIQQEFDEKIDKLIEKTKEKFEYSKVVAEKGYKYEFDKIIEKFEYAKEHGQFPFYLNLDYTTTGLSAYVSSYPETSFVIKQGNNHKGYYTIGNQRYLRYYMNEKPNFVSRFFMDKLLGFKWIDEKTSL
jgi:hypothetical protein